ncbi:MAG TPA: hypothetical protein VET27_08315 [Mycobacterium sp.]|nr:hypothetical protein [Mycobacterium sp.]
MLSGGIDMGELAPLGRLREVDTVIVPGVAEPLSPRSDDLLDGLRAASEAGARLVSFCAARSSWRRRGYSTGGRPPPTGCSPPHSARRSRTCGCESTGSTSTTRPYTRRAASSPRPT